MLHNLSMVLPKLFHVEDMFCDAQQKGSYTVVGKVCKFYVISYDEVHV